MQTEKRYVVTTGPSKTVTYEGNDRDRAEEIANFWDERQDTWFTDRVAEARYYDSLPALEWAMHQFDELEKRYAAGS